MEAHVDVTVIDRHNYHLSALDRPGLRWLEQWTSSPTPRCPATSADRRGRLSVSSSVVEGRPAVLSR